MSTKIRSSALVGIDAEPVEVEADVAAGLPTFTIVGLPDAAVQESRERVRTAIKNSGLEFPRTKVTVNLAPADLKKQGPAYDLPIAIAILESEGIVQAASQKRVFLGELALDGAVRPVSGVLAAAVMAKERGCTEIFVPAANAAEAALVSGIDIIPLRSLSEAARHFRGEPVAAHVRGEEIHARDGHAIDFAEIAGQHQAKRAMEIAAAGGHNLLMNGPPGTGKTMLARALSSILPTMTETEMLEVTRIFSAAGLSGMGAVRSRPFRSPHHTSSGISIIGGGAWPRPGEVSLAHRGVLFLDEMPEFSRSALENLRQPLEDGFVTVSRAASSVRFPANFMLVAARNPCPCGYLGDQGRTCVCPPARIESYNKKISGPLLDRIDLFVEVPRMPLGEVLNVSAGEDSATVRLRVQAARERQLDRLREHKLVSNSEMSTRLAKKFCQMEEKTSRQFVAMTDRLKLSARSAVRVMKISRTIADLDGSDMIYENHLMEALHYRAKG